MKVQISAVAKITLWFDKPIVDMLEHMSKLHYDNTCRQFSLCLMRDKLSKFSDPKMCYLDFTFREVDLMCKIVQCAADAPDSSLHTKFQKLLHVAITQAHRIEKKMPFNGDE